MARRGFVRCFAGLAVAAAFVAGPAAARAGEMKFVERTISTPLTEGVDGSRTLGNGMYEPSMVAAPCPRTRCKGGVVLYVTAHSPGALANRSYAFYSRDRGKTWHNMPGATPTGSTRPIGGVHGAEADFAADGTGRAWLFDAGTAVAPLYGFCGYGAEQCDFVPTANDDDCGPNYLTDRPWIAYGDGKLLLVANAGHLPPFSVQLGIYDPDRPALNLDWNACDVGLAGIVGHPAASSTGDFVIPAVRGDGERFHLTLIEGNVNTGVARDQLRLTPVPGMSFPGWPYSLCGGGGGNWGSAALDSNGAKYATGLASATEFAIAAGAPGAQLQVRTFDAHGKISFLWISGSDRVDGALVTWVVERFCEHDERDITKPLVNHGDIDHSDFYAAHVKLVDGVPTLVNETKVAEDVVDTRGDYLGSSLGPDGKAYVNSYSSDGYISTPGTEPLSVFVQKGGPTL